MQVGLFHGPRGPPRGIPTWADVGQAALDYGPGVLRAGRQLYNAYQGGPRASASRSSPLRIMPGSRSRSRGRAVVVRPSRAGRVMVPYRRPGFAKRSRPLARRRKAFGGGRSKKRARTRYSSRRTGTMSSAPFNPLTGTGVPARLAVVTSVTAWKANFNDIDGATSATTMVINTSGTEENARFSLNDWRVNAVGEYGHAPVGQSKFFDYFANYTVFGCKLTIRCHVAPTVDGNPTPRLAFALRGVDAGNQSLPTTWQGWNNARLLKFHISKGGGGQAALRNTPSVKLSKYFDFAKLNTSFRDDKWNAIYAGTLAATDAAVVEPDTEFDAFVTIYDYDAISNPNHPGGTAIVSFTVTWKYYAVLRGADKSAPAT